MFVGYMVFRYPWHPWRVSVCVLYAVCRDTRCTHCTITPQKQFSENGICNLKLSLRGVFIAIYLPTHTENTHKYTNCMAFNHPQKAAYHLTLVTRTIYIDFIPSCNGCDCIRHNIIHAADAFGVAPVAKPVSIFLRRRFYCVCCVCMSPCIRTVWNVGRFYGIVIHYFVYFVEQNMEYKKYIYGQWLYFVSFSFARSLSHTHTHTLAHSLIDVANAWVHALFAIRWERMGRNSFGIECQTICFFAPTHNHTHIHHQQQQQNNIFYFSEKCSL